MPIGAVYSVLCVDSAACAAISLLQGCGRDQGLDQWEGYCSVYWWLRTGPGQCAGLAAEAWSAGEGPRCTGGQGEGRVDTSSIWTLVTSLLCVQVRTLGQEAERLTRSQPGSIRLIKTKEKEVTDAWTSLRSKVCMCVRETERGQLGRSACWHVALHCGVGWATERQAGGLKWSAELSEQLQVLIMCACSLYMSVSCMLASR